MHFYPTKTRSVKLHFHLKLIVRPEWTFHLKLIIRLVNNSLDSVINVLIIIETLKTVTVIMNRYVKYIPPLLSEVATPGQRFPGGPGDICKNSTAE